MDLTTTYINLIHLILESVYLQKTTFLNEFAVIPAGFNNIPRQVNSDELDSPNWTYHLPIMVEYVARISDEVYFTIGVGYEFDVRINNSVVYNHFFEETQQSLFGGYNFELSAFVNLKNDFFMRFGYKYHANNANIAGSRINAIDSENNTDAVSGHTWTGNYSELSIVLYPPIYWFKKKSKK